MTTNNKPTRILGVDLGKKHVGLALWEAGFIERLPPLAFTTWEKLLSAIMRTRDDYAIDQIIIGKPERGEMVELVDKFVSLLETVDLHAEIWNEDKTSIHARSLAYHSGTNLRTDKAKEHSLAACVLLEDYVASTLA